MKQTFRVIGNWFESKSEQENKLDIYRDLLSRFESACWKYELKEWNPCQNVKLKFAWYKVKDYPDQDFAREYLTEVYTNDDGDIYFAGEKYDIIDDLIEKFKDYKVIAELTVEEDHYGASV